MTEQADEARETNDISRKSLPFTPPGLSTLITGNAPSSLNWLVQQYAQGALASISLMETWLVNYRNMSDAWRAAWREQQDETLASVRAQLKSTLPDQPASQPKDAKKPRRD